MACKNSCHHDAFQTVPVSPSVSAQQADSQACDWTDPVLVIGDKNARDEFTRGMKEITDIAPAIWNVVTQTA